MQLGLKSIDLIDQLSVLLKEKLIDLINLFNLLDFFSLFGCVATLVYFLNYPRDFIIKIRLLEFVPAVCVAVGRLLLVDRSL